MDARGEMIVMQRNPMKMRKKVPLLDFCVVLDGLIFRWMAVRAVKVEVILDRYTFLDAMYRERMDWVGRKIHNIMFHWPRDQLYYNPDSFLDLLGMQRSNTIKE